MQHETWPWRAFLLIFPLLALVPIGALGGYMLWSIAARMEAVERSERFAVDLQREVIKTGLQAVATDLCVLAQQNELSHLLLEDQQQARLAMAAEYLALARNSEDYDQIRFLNEQGQEVIRVNHNGGDPVIVADAALQDKSNRYYFCETMTLEPGQIYVSPLDLNIEHGKIERPYKPMIRVGTPVVDVEGDKRGIVMINVMAQTMLDQFQAASEVSVGQPMMLNNNGYWMVTPEPSTSWGFMFPERSDARMGHLYPEVWAQINQQSSGLIYSADGLFTFENYYPLSGLKGCFKQTGLRAKALSAMGYRRVLVSHVPQTLINGWRREVILQAMIIGAVVLVLLAIGTWAWLVVATERRRYRAHLETMARFDPLTGLANRTTFEERLLQEAQRAKRHDRRFALLFMDLDGFKAINDRHGHKAGDQVLIDVAQVLASNCRATDLAARQGGDEFVVLLAEIEDLAAAEKAAEKLRTHIAALSWNQMQVGASIGLALWPDDADDSETLMRLADDAMYRAKRDGKNRISLAQDLTSDQVQSAGQVESP
jgi:diguanylate cyclase (GGDEF)-like protein